MICLFVCCFGGYVDGWLLDIMTVYMYNGSYSFGSALLRISLVILFPYIL